MKIKEALRLSKQLSAKWSKVLAFLKKLPDDDVLPTWDLAKATGYTSDALTDTMPPDELADYTEKVDGKGRQIRMWGNKKAIKELRRQLKTL
jgi:hypothetical protein